MSLICGALAVVPPAQADPTGETDGPPPGVLVIESFNQTFPWTVQFEQGLVRAQQQAGADTPIYFEYLDSARFPSDGKAFRAYLDAKYADANVGAIVAESLPDVTWTQDNPGFLPTATRIDSCRRRPGSIPADGDPDLRRQGSTAREGVRDRGGGRFPDINFRGEGE